MATVIVGPESDDPGYLQEQIDDLTEDVNALEQRPLAYPVPVSAPTQLVQVNHDPTWYPAGVLCIDALEQITEPDQITHPVPGTTEITFGVSFTGTVYLS